LESVQQPIKCIAVHPFEPYLAIAGKNGYFCIWNYMTKEKLNIDYKNESTQHDPTAMEYTPDGHCLVVGYFEGIVRFLELEAVDLENIHQKIKLKDT
jgi:WD40 repeat protein